jgi:peroxiredoxin
MKIMISIFRCLSVFLLFLITSCDKDKSVIISGKMDGGSGNFLYLDKLEINKTLTLDSLKIRSNENFKFRIKMDHPDIYILRNNAGRFLSILPFPGEKIQLTAMYDSPGKDYTIVGSEESLKIKKLNEKLNETRSKLRNLDASIEKTNSITDSQASEYLNRRKEILKDQRDFSIRFIIENLKSIASIYAVYQATEQNQLVLGENRDIQYMKILADSIQVVYPDVPFVKAFVEDARSTERRYYNLKGISEIMKEAESGIPEIALPDQKGKIINLSSLKGKITLLYFWASASGPSREQNPSLHTIYQKYKSKGFEVYAVSLDNQKDAWERAIRIDELTWINVSDLKFPESNAATIYNITSLPANFLINREGEIIGKELYGNELEKWLTNLLN